VAVDSSPLKNHATVDDQVMITAGRFSTGIATYTLPSPCAPVVSMKTKGFPAMDEPMTVELWMRTTTKSVQPVLAYGNTLGKLELRTWKEEGQYGSYFSFGGCTVGQTGIDVADGTWHFLAVAYDGALVTVYVDGLEAGHCTVDLPFPLSDRPEKMTIGQTLGSDGPCSESLGALRGEFDEVRILDHAISAEQAKGSFGQSPLESVEGTVGLWHFDLDVILECCPPGTVCGAKDHCIFPDDEAPCPPGTTMCDVIAVCCPNDTVCTPIGCLFLEDDVDRCPDDWWDCGDGNCCPPFYSCNGDTCRPPVPVEPEPPVCPEGTLPAELMVQTSPPDYTAKKVLCCPDDQDHPQVIESSPCYPEVEGICFWQQLHYDCTEIGCPDGWECCDQEGPEMGSFLCLRLPDAEATCPEGTMCPGGIDYPEGKTWDSGCCEKDAVCTQAGCCPPGTQGNCGNDQCCFDIGCGMGGCIDYPRPLQCPADGMVCGDRCCPMGTTCDVPRGLCLGKPHDFGMGGCPDDFPKYCGIHCCAEGAECGITCLRDDAEPADCPDDRPRDCDGTGLCCAEGFKCVHGMKCVYDQTPPGLQNPGGEECGDDIYCPEGQECIDGACCPYDATPCEEQCCAGSAGSCVAGTCQCLPSLQHCGDYCCHADALCLGGECLSACNDSDFPEPCGDMCCSDGIACVDGGCVCPEHHSVPCGAVCCLPGGSCNPWEAMESESIDELCGCPEGRTECGDECCLPGEVCSGGDCEDYKPPDINCGTVGSLTCISPAIPGGGVCCVVGTDLNADVGYLIAFGANSQPAGCVASKAMANELGAASGKSYTVVRCERQ